MQEKYENELRDGKDTRNQVKAKQEELIRNVTSLESDNSTLKDENNNLKRQISRLKNENEQLKVDRLNLE